MTSPIESLTVTYRKRTFLVSKCYHEAGVLMDGCFYCEPNWLNRCVELVTVIKNNGHSERLQRKPSLSTNDKVMALPEVVAFTGSKP